MKIIQKIPKISLCILGVAILCFVTFTHVFAAATTTIQDQTQKTSDLKVLKPHHVQIQKLDNKSFSSSSDILHGTVTSVGSDSVTVSTKESSSLTVVTVNEQTLFMNRRGDIATLSDIKVGQRVGIELSSVQGVNPAASEISIFSQIKRVATSKKTY